MAESAHQHYHHDNITIISTVIIIGYMSGGWSFDLSKWWALEMWEEGVGWCEVVWKTLFEWRQTTGSRWSIIRPQFQYFWWFFPHQRYRATSSTLLSPPASYEELLCRVCIRCSPENTQSCDNSAQLSVQVISLNSSWQQRIDSQQKPTMVSDPEFTASETGIFFRISG